MSFHAAAIDILELIASYGAQQNYEKNVPFADVPSELVCIWFDDFYHRTTQFEKEFTKRELDALSEFNEFYDSRVDSLPKSTKGLIELQNCTKWKEISDKAKETLLILKRRNV